MATDLEKLVVQMSADMKGFEREMRRARGISERDTRAIQKNFLAMKRRIDGAGQGLARSITAPLAGIAAALGTTALVQMTGAWTDLTSRVNLAAGGMDRGAEVMARVSEMARRTYSDLTQTAEGYLSFATVLGELHVSTDRQLDFVEALNNALVVSGAKGQVAERVMSALSKAMATGTLRGENLNAVIEVGGRVAQALADSMGVTTTELRSLGESGKIGRREMLGITTQLQKLRDEAASMPGTISDGFMLLNNALFEYVGQGDQAVGVSAQIAEALTMIADNFDQVADAGLQVATVIAGALVGRAMVGLIRTTALGVSGLTALAAALVRVRNVAGVAAAMGGIGAAAAPVAMVVGGALVASMWAFSRSGSEASKVADAFSERVSKIREEAESLSEEMEKAGTASAATQRRAAAEASKFLEAQIDKGKKELETLAVQADALFISMQWSLKRGLVSQEVIDELTELRRKAWEGEMTFNELNDEISRLSSANPNVSRIISGLDAVFAKALDTGAAIRQMISELTGFTSNEEYISSGRGNAIGEYWAEEFKRKDFIAEQQRQNNLSRERQQIERETAAILKEAERSGVALTAAQAEQLAIEKISADLRRSKEVRGGGGKGKKGKSEYADEVIQIREAIAALEAEAKALNDAELSLSGYGDVAAYAQKRMELLVAAQKQGLEITPELSGQIDQLAQDYVKAAAAVEGAKQRHDEFANALAETRSSIEGAFSGLISGALSFKGALSQVIAKLAEMAASRAFDILWDGKGARGSGEGIGTGIGGFVRRILGFERGGPTPAGPRKQAVGVVHAGENVWSQDDIRRAGGMGVVEALRRNGGRIPGYEAGGVVGPPGMPPALPGIPKLSARGADRPRAVEINVNVEGANGDRHVIALVQQGVSEGLSQYDRTLPGRLSQINSNPRRR